ncbi:MAG: TonB-dependent receptor [Bacteroidetes bacterium]|nr:TonB-dependent receptor [Bacteroidota bacterium]
MKHLIIVVLLYVLIPWFSVSGETPETMIKYTINGRVTDKSNGEGLIGASLYIKELNTGTTSDNYGRYSITIPEGQYTLVITYVGFLPIKKEVSLHADTRLTFEMEPRSELLKEIEVTSERQDKNIMAPEMGTFKMNIETIEKIPALMGEVDVIKAIQLLPGVQSVSEGSSGFSVRGGAPDQNLILLDDAPVYNASHLLGFFSVFNNDAIKDVKLYKGDIPANYGGRLSSVLDIHMNEGNDKEYEVNGGIGIISSRLTIEGPIVKDKASFIVSGRRTYADLFLGLSSDKALRNNQLYFYDFNAKVNYEINDNNHVYLSGYFGRDVFKNKFAGFKWGNETATLRWTHLFTKKIFANFTFLYSYYLYNLGTPDGNTTSFVWNSGLQDIGVKGDISYYLNTNNTIRFGIVSTHHSFNPGDAHGTGSSTYFQDYLVPKNYALESAVYLCNEQKIGNSLTVNYGLRFSLFQSLGPTTVYHYNENHVETDSTLYKSWTIYKTYSGLEPRLSAVYVLSERSSVKASYTRTLQYLQLAQNSTAGTPLDFWFPASPNVYPQVGDQVSAGYFRNFKKNTIETSVELYYKWMNDVIDFKDHAQLLLNKQLEGELRVGKAWSYGAEFLVRLNEKRLSGWISYTYSRTFRNIPEINNGNTYPAPYDKPNNIAIVANYQLLKRLDLSANWVYATGMAVTFPTGRAIIGGKVIPIYSDRNAYRYQDYHRLDLSVTWSGKKKPGKKFNWDLNFSVYNVYARHNTWTINFSQDNLDPNITIAERTYLFGVIPSLTFNFHF